MSLLEALAEAVVNVSATKNPSRASKGGGIFGGAPQAQGGGIEDILGAVLGGMQQSGQSGGGAQGGLGGLGGLLEQLTQQSAGQSGGAGGLNDLLGQLTGGGGAQGGALGGIMKALTGAAAGGAAGGAMQGGFGDLLNQAIAGRGQPQRAIPQPSAPQEAAAGLMLRAMIQAAKSDGKFDQQEQSKLLDRLGDVDSQERRFVNDEMAKPVDVAGLANDVPRGMETQVYAMSVMGIDLDNKNEAQYLHSLAENLRIDQRTVNHIHSELGAPALYS